MAYSKIKIINLALIEIGKNPINEIQDAGDLGVSADLLYDLELDSILSNYSWRFNTAQIQLSQLAQEPLKNWQHAYQLPANYLTAIDVIPHSDYEIFEKYIYSDLSELFLKYRFRPTEPNLPSYFVKYFKFELALSLAGFATVKESIVNKIERKLSSARFEATSTDSMARPNTIIKDAKILSARHGGYSRYDGYGGR